MKYLKHLIAVMLDMYELKKAAVVVTEVTSIETSACCIVEQTRFSRFGVVDGEFVTVSCFF